jgi:hypothetical protein
MPSQNETVYRKAESTDVAGCCRTCGLDSLEMFQSKSFVSEVEQVERRLMTVSFQKESDTTQIHLTHYNHYLNAEGTEMSYPDWVCFLQARNSTQS